MSLNLVIMNGRLSKDPDLRTIPSGTEVCEFGLAVDSGFGKNKTVTFIDCTVWGATATFVNTYFKRGDGINIHGRLDLSQWEDKDGNKRSKHRITVERASFPIGKKGGGESDGDGQPKSDDGDKYKAPDIPEIPF